MANAAVRAALAVLDVVGFHKDSLSPEATEADYDLHLRETIGKMTPRRSFSWQPRSLLPRSESRRRPRAETGQQGQHLHHRKCIRKLLELMRNVREGGAQERTERAGRPLARVLCVST